MRVRQYNNFIIITNISMFHSVTLTCCTKTFKTIQKAEKPK